MTDIYLIRHAQSEANLHFIYGSDAPLSNEGMRQATVKSKELQITPDKVISGPKIRQIQTAQILFPRIYKRETDDVFDEINFGTLENSPITPEQNHMITENALVVKYEYGGDDIWIRARRAIDHILVLAESYSIYEEIAIITSDTLVQAMICLLLYGKKDGYIWSTQSHIRNCECIKLVVNDNVVDKKGNLRSQIDRVYINGKNKLKVPAWKKDGHTDKYILI